MMRLPAHLLFILAFCACSLAVHFIAEDLAPAVGGPGLAAQAGRVHPADGHGGENFIFPALAHLPAGHPAAPPQSSSAAGVSSLPISPLHPPPNL